MPKSKKIIPKPDQRTAALLVQKNLKMARSAQSFVRGSTFKFYEWLEKSGDKLPNGPPDELIRHATKKAEVPPWLWDGVVELIATHVAAYLEHCRSYVMSLQKPT
jgi:uncharacterized protein (DUF2252 family)